MIIKIKEEDLILAKKVGVGSTVFWGVSLIYNIIMVIIIQLIWGI